MACQITVRNGESGVVAEFLERAVWRRKFVIRVRHAGHIRHWEPSNCTVFVNGRAVDGNTFYKKR